jgi:hypothetical protein
MPDDAWSWWQAKLAGKPVEANPDSPHAGFFRQSHKAFYGARKTFLPVAYWPDENGQLRCRIGDRDVNETVGMQAWNWVHDHPVTEAAYRAVAERGELWPDEHELVSLRTGDNLPPEEDTFEGLKERIDDLAREANKRIEGAPIKDQAEADQIANLTDRLAELWKKADELRKTEKKPHDQAAIAVQKKWAPLLIAAEAYKNLKYALLTPWLKKLEDIQKREAATAAAAGTPPAETARPRAGTRGRAMSLKTAKRAEITDQDACYQFFKDSPDIKATLQDLANRAVRAGVSVPGAKVLEETQAV